MTLPPTSGGPAAHRSCSALRRAAGVAARAFAAGLVVAGGQVVARPASGASLPFSDPNAHGYIGFCSKDGQAVTSGNLADEPFAWQAVSSDPAPAGYERGKATLVAYQPRPQVPAAEWSGQQMTGSSTFSNAAHPLVQATASDSPLLNFVQAYPPEVDGLVELRIYYSGIDLPVESRTYPATVVQVSGGRWSVVGGGTVNCSTAGHGTSDEAIELPASQVGTPQPLDPAGLPPGAASPTTTVAAPSQPGAGAGAAAGAAVPPPPVTATGSRAGAQRSAAAPLHPAKSSGLGTGAIVAIAIGVATVVGVVASMLRWRARRP